MQYSFLIQIIKMFYLKTNLENGGKKEVSKSYIGWMNVIQQHLWTGREQSSPDTVRCIPCFICQL